MSPNCRRDDRCYGCGRIAPSDRCPTCDIVGDHYYFEQVYDGETCQMYVIATSEDDAQRQAAATGWPDATRVGRPFRCSRRQLHTAILFARAIERSSGLVHYDYRSAYPLAPTPLALPPAGDVACPATGGIKLQAMSLYGRFGAKPPASLYFNSICGKIAETSLAIRAGERDEQNEHIPPYCIEDVRVTYDHLTARLKSDLEEK